MQRWPATRDTLLMKLAGAEFDSVWHEFSRHYEPLIYRFGRNVDYNMPMQSNSVYLLLALLD